MRLWSLCPRYLDNKGLVACWSEGLLAQSVLLQGEYKLCPNCYEGKTIRSGLARTRAYCKKCNGQGIIKTPYYNHSQMLRFKNCKDPMRAIGYYLNIIWHEASKRGYKFDFNKIKITHSCPEFITVTKGQLQYEFEHLSRKLNQRNHNKNYCNEMDLNWKRQNIKAHSLFKIIEGNIESWERIK